jgi:hypothetical protein
VIALNLIYLVLTGTFGFENLREITYQSGTWSTTYKKIYFSNSIYILYCYIIRGYIVFDFGLSTARFVKNRAQISVLSILNACLFCFIQLSRIEILRMALIFVLIVLLSGTELKALAKLRSSKKFKRAIFVAVAFSVCVVVLRNYQKSSYVMEALKHLTGDMSGPYVAFGEAWNSFLKGYIPIEKGIFSFVEAMLGGLSSTMITVINIIFGTNYISTNTLINNYTGTGILNIGLGYQFNAFYTMYCAPMISGGYVGCYIMSAAFGIFAATTYKKHNLNSVQLWRCVYILMIILFGIFNYQWQSISAWVTLVLTFTVSRERIVNE